MPLRGLQEPSGGTRLVCVNCQVMLSGNILGLTHRSNPVIVGTVQLIAVAQGPYREVLTN